MRLIFFRTVQLRAKGNVAGGGAHPLSGRPLGVPHLSDWCVRMITKSIACVWSVCRAETVFAVATDHISKIEARAGRHLIDQNFSRFGAGAQPGVPQHAHSLA